MKKWISVFLCLCLLAGLSACGGAPQEDTAPAPEPAEESGEETVEVAGQTVPVDDSVDPSAFAETDFAADEETGRITCISRTAYAGVDVSSHQGEIDWAAVAGDGIDFAILRIGNRGYTEGGLMEDKCFEANYSGATENGLKVGVYFFSQAVTEAEAVEEAEFVLEKLDGRELSLPVVFDWETIEGDTARTDGLDCETVTSCAIAFCDRIAREGYSTAVYFNSMLGYLNYDFTRLQSMDAWYAEYGTWPSFRYAFDLWQYTTQGSVEGIEGNVDMDLWFPEEAEGA